MRHLPSILLLLAACTGKPPGPLDTSDDRSGGSGDSEDTDTGPQDTDTADTSPIDTGAPQDEDGDGWLTPEDCDDADPDVSPGATESCNGEDDDCDGATDESDAPDARTWYPDADGDGWGTSDGATVACDQPAHTAGRDGDCDDTRADIRPDAAEEDCTDPVDYNCDGSTGYADGDADGWPACSECNDGDPSAYPDAPEVEADGVDQDCDGWDLGADADADGVYDYDEAALGTDPADADSDDDGLSDGEEVAAGTDPLLTDTDGDGLDDGDEAAEGADPLLADTDGDGWDDGDEVDDYTDPADATDHPYTGGWSIDACRDSIVSTGTGVGDIAPNFALTDEHGDTVRLHDFCERVVLLDFTEFW